MNVYELFTELSSEKRLSILKALDEKPMKFTKLSKEFEMTSPEASRQLNRLTDAELIEKKADGNYYLTFLGKLILSSISDLKFIWGKSEYFLTHDTSPIPPHLLSQIDALSSGEIVTGVYEIMNTLDKSGKDIKEFDWYMADDFPRHYLPMIEEKCNEGIEVNVILPKGLVTTVLPTVSEKIREKVCIRVLDEVKISITVTDSVAALGLPGQNGKIDHDEKIFGHDDRFKDWCKELFKYYWEKAKPIDG